MPLLGQRQQVFTQKGNLLDMHTQFARARAKQISADADVVAQIEQLVQLESLVAHGVFLNINLQSLPALLQVGKAGLAHQANGHDASRHADIDARLFQLLGGLGGVLREDLLQRVSEFVFAAVGSLAERLNLLQLLAPQVVNVIVECQWCPFISQRWKGDYKQCVGAS